MNLVHYSATPIQLLKSMQQEPRVSTYYKPNGLWVSVEGDADWKEWCESEEFALNRLACAHDVILKKDSNILHLASAMDIDLFTERYGSREYAGSTGIRWFDVAAEHQGIIIAPYIYARRLDGGADWYYGWDCASGCIWDVSAIERIELRVPESVP